MIRAHRHYGHSELRELVPGQVHSLLEHAPVSAEYRELIQADLLLPGHILSTEPALRWSRMLLTCCGAAGGRESAAIEVAAIVEIFMATLNILDELQGAEPNEIQSSVGLPRTLNLSTGLVLLVNWSLSTYPNLADILVQAGLKACSGQDGDLQGAAGTVASLEDAVSITAAKSASLVAAICQLGALCASRDSLQQEHYAHFGWNMGMMLQLLNDLSALQSGAKSKAVALLQHPAPLLIGAVHNEKYGTIGRYSQQFSNADVAERTVRHLTWVVAEVHRRRAVALLPRLTTDPYWTYELATLLENGAETPFSWEKTV